MEQIPNSLVLPLVYLHMPIPQEELYPRFHRLSLMVTSFRAKMEGPNSKEIQVALNNSKVFSREAMSKRGPVVVKRNKRISRATLCTRHREQFQGTPAKTVFN